MGDVFERLTEAHTDFIGAQKLFFVATAPAGADGRVNVSPKGYDSLVFDGDARLHWLDLGGSGIETVAHLRENGRITLMFCAFEGRPLILRVYGRGRVTTFDEPGFDALLARFDGFDRARAVVTVDIDRVAESCGWGVPFYQFDGEREQLARWVDHRPVDEWKARRYQSNATSIDGLPGLTPPPEDH
ncbi:MAG: pyridoxamine 5'-phosphate oxidase family protein [Pseudomonadota bacterium]